MIELDPVVKEFLVESYENLDRLDLDLVALEKDAQNRERLSSVFRTIHTIKGTCGFFGFSKLESVTHVGENLLSLLRDGELLLDSERTSALLALVDAVRAMLGNIEKTGADGDSDYPELIARLTALLDSPVAAAAPAPPNRAKKPETIGEVLIQEGKAKPEQVLEAVQQQLDGDPLHLGEILVEKGIVQMQDIREAVNTLQENKGAVAETTIRVDVSLLDKLMNLVGELVLARNQVLQVKATQKDPAFLSTSQRLNLITTELQESVMKTRMQPIGGIWNRLPRVVRDLAVTCGKEVQLEMEGNETELDRTIIEAIKDPLTHIVRNSIDHGIEKPDVRLASGKPGAGTLRLRAFHEGGQVHIEIRDDGAGINAERVRAKALERGLISREQASRMNDREAAELIFVPGFSTAENVTHVSGRGVGMDVVKTNIERIGGTVDLQSQMGKGITLRLKIPQTLAIIPALIVISGGQRFAVPQVNLLELVRLEGEQAAKRIERIDSAPVYRLRGNLLPLVYLDQELACARESKHAASNVLNIVVLRADKRQFGLVVDGIADTEEIVVKPLGKFLKGISAFAGATIMGDGKITLILDVLGVAQRAGVVSEGRDRAVSRLAVGVPDKETTRHALLLLSVGKSRRAAIPLSMVTRLEEIPAARVEYADGQEVVQYRGQILPLIRLSAFLGVEPADRAEKTLQVIVYSERGRSVGFVVDRILDIVETRLDVHRKAVKPAIVATAVIQQHVCDLIDIHAVIRSIDPRFFDPAVAI
jgi:two-component system, chemotaxis family, sensor kinase CheA